MQPTGDRTDRPITEVMWQPPLEADSADAREQAREVIDDVEDPEAPVLSKSPDLDLSRASEADLAEQLHEIVFDDELDR